MEAKRIDRPPMSGTQKALRLGICLGVLLVVWLIWGLSRSPYMRPVRTFYKGLSAEDTAKMTDAFPSWLVDVPRGGTEMTVTDMCSASLTIAKLTYGAGVRVRAGEISQTETDAATLEKIAAGIDTQYHVKAKVTRGLRVTLHVTYTDTAGMLTDTTEYVRIYKINGRWVLLDIPSTTED